MVEQLFGQILVDRVAELRVGEGGDLGPELGFTLFEASLQLQLLLEHCSL